MVHNNQSLYPPFDYIHFLQEAYMLAKFNTYLHNIGQRGETGLVEAQVSGEHSRQGQLQLFAASVRLATHLGSLHLQQNIHNSKQIK